MDHPRSNYQSGAGHYLKSGQAMVRERRANQGTARAGRGPAGMGHYGKAGIGCCKRCHCGGRVPAAESIAKSQKGALRPPKQGLSAITLKALAGSISPSVPNVKSVELSAGNPAELPTTRMKRTACGMRPGGSRVFICGARFRGAWVLWRRF